MISRIACSIVIVFIMLFFIPVLVKESGLKGMLTSIVLFTTLLIIPAIGTRVSKNKSDLIYCIINIFGFIWISVMTLTGFAATDLFSKI